MQARIKIEKFCYSADSEVVLRDLDFSIEAGQIYHIMGPSGCGKSTLLAILSRDLPAAGDFSVFHGDVSGLDQFSGVRTTQDPQMQLAAATVIDELLLAPEYHEPDALTAINRALESAREFKLTHLLEKDTHHLSFGQARILGLALAWQYRPKILFLDEPFSGLDKTYQNLLSQVIQKINSEGCTVILTHTSSIFGGRIISLNPLSSSEISSAPEFPVVSATGPIMGESLDWPTRNGEGKINFRVEPGEMLLITGPNGFGKTQLLQRLARISDFSSGRFEFAGKCAYSPQSPDQEIFSGTLLDEILVGSNEDAGTAEKLADFFQLKPFLLQSPILLSFGQKKRVSLIGAFLRKTECLLLDEPTAGLDPANRHRLMLCLSYFIKHGGIVICATHDPDQFNEFKPKLLQLDALNNP